MVQNFKKMVQHLKNVPKPITNGPTLVKNGPKVITDTLGVQVDSTPPLLFRSAVTDVPKPLLLRMCADLATARPETGNLKGGRSEAFASRAQHGGQGSKIWGHSQEPNMQGCQKQPCRKLRAQPMLQHSP